MTFPEVCGWWQAIQWSGASNRIRGSSSAQRASARGQRARKRQPLGGDRGLADRRDPAIVQQPVKTLRNHAEDSRNRHSYAAHHQMVCTLRACRPLRASVQTTSETDAHRAHRDRTEVSDGRPDCWRRWWFVPSLHAPIEARHGGGGALNDGQRTRQTSGPSIVGRMLGGGVRMRYRPACSGGWSTRTSATEAPSGGRDPSSEHEKTPLAGQAREWRPGPGSRSAFGQLLRRMTRDGLSASAGAWPRPVTLPRSRSGAGLPSQVSGRGRDH